MKRILICFILAIASPCWAIDKGAGTAGSSFLKLGVGARALSLADTFTAVSGDSSSIFFNPAGSAELPAPAFFTSASQWIAGTRYGSLAYIHPFKRKVASHRRRRKKKSAKKQKKRALSLGEGVSRSSRFSGTTKTSPSFVAGIGVLYFDAGSMDKTDKDQFDLVVPLGTQVKAADQLLLANLSKSFGKYSIGLNMKYITQTLGSYSASAYAADAGVIYHVLHTANDFIWDSGLAYHNAGTELDFRKETPYTDKLPASIRFGNICQKGKLKIGLDLVLPSDNNLRGTAGLEYQLLGGAAFRLGLKAFGWDELGDDYYFSNMRVGIGIPIVVVQGMCDYAFVPMGDLGFSHHISVTIFFVRPEEKEESSWFSDDL